MPAFRRENGRDERLCPCATVDSTRFSAAAVSLVLAGCATVAPSPFPDSPGPSQALRVTTDPPGANCTITQDGNLVGTVVSTPGSVSVRRDFCFRSPGTTYAADYCQQSVERIAPVVVACRKEGYLEQQKTLVAADRNVVESEEGAKSELSPLPDMARALGVAGMLLPPVGSFLLLPALAAVAATNPDHSALTFYPYAYRALPEMILVPAMLPSGRACDEFFATLEGKLRRSAEARHAYIDRQCIFAPCTPNDAAPCADPECRGRHARVDADLRAQLDELPARRAQVCTVDENPARTPAGTAPLR